MRFIFSFSISLVLHGLFLLSYSGQQQKTQNLRFKNQVSSLQINLKKAEKKGTTKKIFNEKKTNPLPAVKAPSPSVAIFSQPPKYPEVARVREMEGRVLLELVINKQGEVLKALIRRSSGHEILDREAQKAASAWRFPPQEQLITKLEKVVQFKLR